MASAWRPLRDQERGTAALPLGRRRRARSDAWPHGRAVLGRKDSAAWSIPKGQREEGEEALATARREFEEEIGQPPPDGEVVALGDVRQSGGRKIVEVWAIEGDIDVSSIESTSFEMEWPPKSGELREFPELDRAEWFDVDTARGRIVKAQAVFLDRLVELVNATNG